MLKASYSCVRRATWAPAPALRDDSGTLDLFHFGDAAIFEALRLDRTLKDNAR